MAVVIEVVAMAEAMAVMGMVAMAAECHQAVLRRRPLLRFRLCPA